MSYTVNFSYVHACLVIYVSPPGMYKVLPLTEITVLLLTMLSSAFLSRRTEPSLFGHHSAHQHVPRLRCRLRDDTSTSFLVPEQFCGFVALSFNIKRTDSGPLPSTLSDQTHTITLTKPSDPSLLHSPFSEKRLSPYAELRCNAYKRNIFLKEIHFYKWKKIWKQ